MFFSGDFTPVKNSKPLIDLNILVKESSALYYSKRNEYLTITDLKKFMGPPSGTVDTVSDEDRAERFLIGRASHALILEGKETFNNEYTAIKSKEDRREFLTESQYQTVINMKTTVQENPYARMLLQDGTAERVVRAKYRRFSCQIRIDWFNPCYGLIDLKTTDSFSQFDHEIQAYRYYEQLSFFRAILREATGVSVPVFFIVVSKREIKCEVQAIPAPCLDHKETEIQEYLKRLESHRPPEMWSGTIPLRR